MERNHFTMKCPADYNDSMQSDSDSVNNTEYIQEVVNAPPSPVSPQLSGGLSSAYRKRQREKKSQGRQDSFDAANKLLNDKRNRITTPTQEEDDDEISRPATESIRKKRSMYVISLVLYGNMSKSYLMWTKLNVIIVLAFGGIC